MQLHPFFATVTRPVYHDRQGFLFLAAECPECEGNGTIDCDNGVDGFSKPFTICCGECNGTGQVYKEISEDDL